MQKVIIDRARLINHMRQNKKRFNITADEIFFILNHHQGSHTAILECLLNYIHCLSELPLRPIGVCLSLGEIELVTQNIDLSVDEKILWLLLSVLSANHPHLQWQGMYQFLAQCLNRSADNIRRILHYMMIMDFVMVEDLTAEEKCITITLPSLSILKLMQAPQEKAPPFQEAYEDVQENCTINLFPNPAWRENAVMIGSL